jgi:hypothetical protein
MLRSQEYVRLELARYILIGLRRNSDLANLINYLSLEERCSTNSITCPIKYQFMSLNLFAPLTNIASSVTSKVSSLNSLALVLTCGAATTLSIPAQAASFEGFGCSDNLSCGSYVEFGGGVQVGTGHGFGGGVSDEQSVSLIRSSALGFVPSTLISNLPYSETFTDFYLDQFGQWVERPRWTMGGHGTAVLQSNVNLGQLKASASATVSTFVTPRTENAGAAIGQASALAGMGWGDTITVTSSTYLPGELVPFELRLYLDRTVRAISGNFSGDHVYAPTAHVYASLLDLHIFDSTSSPSASSAVTRILYLPVGELFPIEGRLSLMAATGAYASLPEYPTDYSMAIYSMAIADAFHTANYYLTPLVNGVSYTSASGKTYFYPGDATLVPTPALLPGLIGLGLNLWRKRRNEVREKQA